MILIALLIIIAILIYVKAIRPYSYWTERGVKQRKQVYLLGDNASIMLRTESFFDNILSIYKAFPDERYVGMYQGLLPTLVIRDPELIKQITVKEFDHFLNHRSFIPDNVDPIWSRNLFALKDMQWRDMRSTLSPSFTSSKMRVIFSLVSDCADIYLDHFRKKEGIVEIDLKDTLTRYTNDVIATVAFGIKCDSINEKDNEFYEMGKKTTNFTFWRSLAFFLYSIVPSFCKALGIKMFPRDVSDFFLKLVRETIDTREKEGIVRPDMINQLLEARKNRKQESESSNEAIDTGFATVEESSMNTPTKQVKEELTDLDIAAQALLFFFGGFDSVATLMCFLGYELAVNPDIQERLQDEIDITLQECNGKLTYEVLMKMKYMDMVVSETLRKWPGAIGTDRVCSKAFTIEPEKPHEKPIHLTPGDIVFVAINGIHRDPRYYPNPDTFDPERFSDENKAKIQPYTYIPFGLGPRNCIGSRFALLETKTIFFHLLSKFNIIATKKTQIPLMLSKKSFNMNGENGIWIGLQVRTK